MTSDDVVKEAAVRAQYALDEFFEVHDHADQSTTRIVAVNGHHSTFARLECRQCGVRRGISLIVDTSPIPKRNK